MFKFYNCTDPNIVLFKYDPNIYGIQNYSALDYIIDCCKFFHPRFLYALYDYLERESSVICIFSSKMSYTANTHNTYFCILYLKVIK